MVEMLRGSGCFRFAAYAVTLPATHPCRRRKNPCLDEANAIHKYKPGVQKMESMDARKFTLHVIKSPEGGFTGRCLELPAAISEGDTMEELEANMKEVIQLVMESIEKKTRPDQKVVIEIPS